MKTVTVPLERLMALVDWMQTEQENNTCSDICDKTFEFQGCTNGCALEEGKKEIEWWVTMLAAAQQEADHGYKRIGIGRCNQRGEVVDIAQSEQDAEMWAYGTVDLYVKEDQRTEAASGSPETKAEKAMTSAPVAQSSGPQCNPHPDAPHGFDRQASHAAGREVCECESWKPPTHPTKEEAMEISYSPHRLHSSAVQPTNAEDETCPKCGEPFFPWCPTMGCPLGTKQPTDAERLAEIYDMLESVLCNPDGKCCISGSDADRAEVDAALGKLAALRAKGE